ncbi:MAG: YicC family protein [Oscillospiraceae bacterium]|nr:YicC family protein [Oscillospiraceae bacterium]
MVRSMTGFGRAEVLTEQYKATCEVKSVNHRYFEFSARAPRSCGFLEERLKRFFQERVSRGKIECYVSLEFLGDSEIEVKLNGPLLAGYLEAFKQAKQVAMEQRYGGIDSDLAFSDLLRVPDLFQTAKRSVDEEAVWAVVAQAAGEACDKFIAMREAEGRRLQDDILARADDILRHVAFIEERSPQTVLEYNEKLLSRMKELLESATIDEQRLLTEAAIFADKIAVAEETVRLRSHLQQMAEFFTLPEAVGRKMDFLVQEINREANTIGSKASDIEIARRVVEIKSNVEKIREQVQNIE